MGYGQSKVLTDARLKSEKWKKKSDESRIKVSKAMKERVANGTHNFWKGGLSKVNHTERLNTMNTIEYRLWRTHVFERDNYKCTVCGTSGYLHAHHIKEYSKFQELRFDLENGVTLCRDCHKETHKKMRELQTATATIANNQITNGI